jgi:hypothetical protein
MHLLKLVSFDWFVIWRTNCPGNWRESVSCHNYQESFGVEYSIFLPLFLQRVTLIQHQWKCTFHFLLYLFTFSGCNVIHLYHTWKSLDMHTYWLFSKRIHNMIRKYGFELVPSSWVFDKYTRFHTWALGVKLVNCGNESHVVIPP